MAKAVRCQLASRGHQSDDARASSHCHLDPLSGLDAGIAVEPVALGFIIGLSSYAGLILRNRSTFVSIVVYWLTHGRHAVESATASQHDHDN